MGLSRPRSGYDHRHLQKLAAPDLRHPHLAIPPPGPQAERMSRAIALIAHDAKKPDMVAFSMFNSWDPGQPAPYRHRQHRSTAGTMGRPGRQLGSLGPRVRRPPDRGHGRARRHRGRHLPTGPIRQSRSRAGHPEPATNLPGPRCAARDQPSHGRPSSYGNVDRSERTGRGRRLMPACAISAPAPNSRRRWRLTRP